MKQLIILVILIVVGSMTPALAEQNLMTDDQLDEITAGQATNGDQQVSVANQDIATLNVVNFADTSESNSKVDDDSVNILIVKDAAQLNARAVTIVNNIKGSAANAVNAHANRGEARFLNQSNVINQR